MVGVFGLPVHRLAAQVPRQHLGRAVGGRERQRHAGAENRVEKFRGVAGEREPFAEKFFHRARVTADALRRKNELHVREAPGGVRVARQNRAQLRGGFAGKFLEKFRRRHRADAGLAVGKRDDPEPRAVGVDADPDFSLLALGGTPVAGDVGEERLAVRKRGRRFEVQQARQHAPVAATVEDEF